MAWQTFSMNIFSILISINSWSVTDYSQTPFLVLQKLRFIDTFLCAIFLFLQDSIQKILLSLTSRIAGTHLIHEKRRILSMYRLFVLLLLKDLSGGLGNTWAFFIRDVIYSLLRIISDETQFQQSRHVQQQVNLVVDDDLFLPCCNLLYYVCKAAVDCCSQVR